VLPTIVFFANAFINPLCFYPFAALFKDKGHTAVYAHVLLLNPLNPKNVTIANDAAYACKKVSLLLLKDGKDFIVFTYLYSRVISGAVAAGLSKSLRLIDNKEGSVIRLLYLARNIVYKGKTLLEAVRGLYPPLIKENTVSCNKYRMQHTK
jgi:hypothetical protein